MKIVYISLSIITLIIIHIFNKEADNQNADSKLRIELIVLPIFLVSYFLNESNKNLIEVNIIFNNFLF